MKTNVIMKSKDRNLFGAVIRQETKTGFLNLSDLQNCFESLRTIKGWTNKHIPELISRRENVERIFYVLDNQKVINVDLSTFIELVDKQGIATTLKSFGEYKTTGARHTKTTWVNPYIWILVALELSPEFYAKSVVWLTDKLILNRIEAGNFCTKLNSAIHKFNPTSVQFIELAKALNHTVFGQHFAGIRNTGTRDQLNELTRIEENMAFAIERNWITSFEMLLQELRVIYKQKYLKSIQ